MVRFTQIVYQSIVEMVLRTLCGSVTAIFDFMEEMLLF